MMVFVLTKHGLWKVFQKNTKINIAVQINGKTRGVIEVKKDATKNEAIEMTKKDTKIKKHLESKKIIKEISCPNKIINLFVV